MKLAAGFDHIHLGEEEEQETDLTNECLWVPASVRHEVRKDNVTGQSRYSFFVYGGVNIQPRINVVQRNSNDLGGNRVGSVALNNVNAQAAMNAKMSGLQKAQNIAVRTEHIPDGRIRYYEVERRSKIPGPTRGASYVTEYNPKTGDVRG
jgi:hypothetical protein